MLKNRAVSQRHTPRTAPNRFVGKAKHDRIRQTKRHNKLELELALFCEQRQECVFECQSTVFYANCVHSQWNRSRYVNRRMRSPVDQ